MSPWGKMLLLGLDLGAVSVKAALLGIGEAAPLASPSGAPEEIWAGAASPIPLLSGESAWIQVAAYRRTRGRPLDATRSLLADVLRSLDGRRLDGIRVTGSGAGLLHSTAPLPEANEFHALAVATWAIAPDARTLFEIGGESSKLLLFERDASSGDLGIADYQTNGDCAAGTGTFLDQQAGRLRYPIEEVGGIAASSERAAKIAGRCSVFAKSDMIHAQQKGYLPPEVLRGLCETVARNFRSAVARGRTPQPPVIFVGGVAANEMVVAALKKVFELDQDLEVPIHHAAHAAIGCALLEAAEREHVPFSITDLDGIQTEGAGAGVAETSRARPLSMDKVILLRDRIHPIGLPSSGPRVEVALGIDIGSVSTNVVLLDREGRIVREIYTRTQARPVEVVTAALEELKEELGNRVTVRAVGTTGSGRELIGELVGADSINDEITAHKTGATFIARTMLQRSVDTIFEIGGQDSKYIRIEDGVVVDFAMNEACAAGTGSFLEERAEELGVSIKNEFARRALASPAPVRLGERCTVFMERDVNAWQQRGAATDDLLAGLALSVATNYINRVVRGRRIEGTIFFQGGTAYNDAVAAAFSQILDREIIVPPYNGVVGAVGAALLAWEKEEKLLAGTRFRGWNLGSVDYQIREFTCQGCENRCDMQEFRVEGEKTYWGDQCGDRYRRRAKVELQPVIEDLVRLRRELLVREYEPGERGRVTVAMPRALYFHERFPFWNGFFRELGYGIRITSETNRQIAQEGVEAAAAEPCFPLQVAHGHVAQALALDADFVFIPNYVNAESAHPRVQSFFCPWGMTLPFVVQAAASFEGRADRILHPAIRFRLGLPALEEPLAQALRKYGVRRGAIRRALASAEEAQARFRRSVRELGTEALERLRETREPAVLLVGRPYNLFDPVVNLDLPKKMRDLYGVNVLPMEFLAADETDLEAVNANMFWSYGRKILAAAREAAGHADLHLVYVTNFKCGPDSYVKHFVRDAFGRAFLTLQFDGHANDAGMLTRVEAFLDSQGILRRWAGRPRDSESGTETPLPPPGLRPGRDRAPVFEAAGDCADCASRVSCPRTLLPDSR